MTKFFKLVHLPLLLSLFLAFTIHSTFAETPEVTEPTETTHCAQYNEDKTKCISCDKGWGLDSEEKCVECTASCADCSEDATKCKQCDAGHFLTEKHECEKCALNCDECESETQCKKCVDTYFADNKGVCQKCDANCEKCGPNGCEKCGTAFHPNAAGFCTNCKDTMPHCLDCNSDTVCDKCEDSFFVLKNSHECKSCGPACASCTSLNHCDICADPHCVDCDSQTCRECKPGYFSDDEGKCQKCADNCSACTDLETCNVCSKGYFHIQEFGLCEKCCPHCITCNQSGCEKCAYQYFIDEDTGKCGACSLLCDECTSESSCDVCISGYFLDKYGSCQQHDINCLQQGENGCLKCFEKYFVEETSGMCGECSSDCIECTSYDNCLSCNPPLIVNSDGDCQEKSNMGLFIEVIIGVCVLFIAWLIYANHKRTQVLKLEQALWNDSGDINH